MNERAEMGDERLWILSPALNFEVTRSAARRGVAITNFDVAGAPVSINAYGRKARARRFDSMEEMKDQRRQAAAFDSDAKPALLTVEIRVHF